MTILWRNHVQILRRPHKTVLQAPGPIKLCEDGNGGAEGDRTPDLVIANDALSQLSYSPVPVAGLMIGMTYDVKHTPALVGCMARPWPVGSAGARGNTHFMDALVWLIEKVISLYIWAIIIAAVMSTLASFGVLDSRNRMVWTVMDFLDRVTAPILNPIRRVIPFLGNIDISPLIAILLLGALQRLISELYFRFMMGGF
jgi:YggT family protein